MKENSIFAAFRSFFGKRKEAPPNTKGNATDDPAVYRDIFCPVCGCKSSGGEFCKNCGTRYQIKE